MTDEEKSTAQARDMPATPVQKRNAKQSSLRGRKHGASPSFVATPALKSARTRAFKTLERFSADEARSQSPSNVFVSLRIPSGKLRQSGVPVIKTKWEDSHVSDVTGGEGVSTGNEGGHIPALAVAKDDTGGRLSTKGKDVQMLKGGKDTSENSGRSIIGEIEANPLLGFSRSTTQATSTPAFHQPTNDLSYTCLRDVYPSHQGDQWHPASSEGSRTQCRTERPLGEDFRNIADRLLVEARQLSDINKSNTAATASKSSQQKGDISVLELKDVLTKLSWNIDQLNSLARVDNHQALPNSANELENTSFEVAESSVSKRTAAIEQIRQQLITTAPDTPSRRDSNKLDEIEEMAPVRDPNNVDNALKDAIQKLYEVQSQVHGFVPETQPLLIDKMTELAQSLSHLQTLTSPTSSPNNPIHKNYIAPEVIDYVDGGRNPDIYNREFVELVQRGNVVMKGKQKGFRDFSKIFAKTLKENMPELGEDVDRIMENAKMYDNEEKVQKPGNGDVNGAGKTEKKNEA